MRCTVTWNNAAQNELATLWTDADSATRQAITQATHQIPSTPEFLGALGM